MATMRQLGVEVRDVRIPSLAAAPSFLLIMLAEAYAYHERDLRTHPELYGNVLRERMMAGGLVTGSEYVQAQRIRAQIAQDVAAVLREVDMLATPTALFPALPFTRALDPELGFPRSNMPPFNITGSPTLALPCGFSSSGLPLSLQLAGRPFEEAHGAARRPRLRAGHAVAHAPAVGVSPTTKGERPWSSTAVDVATQFKRMRELVPETYRAFLDFDKQAFKDGAIPGKTKELIALGIAQITQCPWCIQAHTKKAATAGASDAEIAETTFVAMAMAAGAAWSHGGLALQCLQEHKGA